VLSEDLSWDTYTMNSPAANYLSVSPKCSYGSTHTHNTHTHTHTHNRFTALLKYVRDHPGEQVPER